MLKLLDCKFDDLQLTIFVAVKLKKEFRMLTQIFDGKDEFERITVNCLR